MTEGLPSMFSGWFSVHGVAPGPANRAARRLADGSGTDANCPFRPQCRGVGTPQTVRGQAPDFFPVFRCKTMRSPFILTSALAVLLALVGVRTAAVQESRFCLPGNAALQGMTKAPAPVFRPGPAGEPSNLSAGPGMAVGSLKTVG